MKVLALDLSLVSTGVCHPDGVPSRLRPGNKKGAERLAWYYDAVGPLMAEADVVVVEGYSFNSKFKGEFLGELGGVVRLRAFQLGVPLVELPPARIKKYATGNGGAAKDQVLLAAARRFPYFDGDNNMADALWAWALAKMLAGEPVVDMPKSHCKAAEGIEWPL